MRENATVTFESYRDCKGYVINLAREDWKYREARRKLTDLGFSNISRWEATDYKKEDVNAEIRRMGAPRLERFVNDAEIALVLGHYRIWMHFLSTSDPYCMVFEDDVVGVEDFESVADFNDLTYKEFDILSFGGIYLDVPEEYGSRNYVSLAQAKERQGNKSYIKGSSFWQSHAYLITRSGAYKALYNYPDWASCEEYRQPQIDNYIANCRYLDVALACNQKIGDVTRYNLHKKYVHDYGMLADRFCGILLQENGYVSTIQY
jgi:hypothetical protein